MSKQTHANLHLQQQLCRIAQFGANIADAHSCFIFLPSQVLQLPTDSGSRRDDEEALELVGYHSLSNDVIEWARLPVSSGLMGWAAKHNRLIHVSPFERDSRTLGIYSKDQSLKSFLAAPLQMPSIPGEAAPTIGVIACDSKKAYAFSKLQGKLIENLACEITNLVALIWRCKRQGSAGFSWEQFILRAKHLVDNLGPSSVDLLRVSLTNARAVEQRLGAGRYIELSALCDRLIGQALPPYCPLYRLPNGDLLIALDNMITAFIQNKINAIAAHLSPTYPLIFEHTKISCKPLRNESITLEQLMSESATTSSPPGGMHYEFRRA